MGAAINNMPRLHDHDSVYQFQRRHAVSNHHRGAALDEFCQCFMDQPFTFGIDLAGRFIENQNFGINLCGVGLC